MQAWEKFFPTLGILTARRNSKKNYRVAERHEVGDVNAPMQEG